MSDKIAFFLQVISPLLVVGGVVYQGFRILRLRQKQRDALHKLYAEFLELGQCKGKLAVVTKIARIRMLFDYFDKSIFSSKAPTGLLDQIIDMMALIKTLESEVQTSLHRPEIDGNLFRKHIEQAADIKKRSHLVLYSL